MHLPPNTLPIGVLSKQSRRQQLLSRLCPWLLRLLSLWKAFFAALVICSSVKRMSKCLDSIFWDYKNHFAAYNLDHIIQVDARNDKTINTTLQEFLQSYGQSYNHLLAQTKISTINKFYKEKEPINLQICQVYYNNAKKVLSYADEQMTRAAKNAFQRDNNLS
jgi:hypothetical protein